MQPDLSVGGKGGPDNLERPRQNRRVFQQLQDAVQILEGSVSGQGDEFTQEADAPEVRATCHRSSQAFMC